jgi:ATP-binding cassette subfamily F protein 3
MIQLQRIQLRRGAKPVLDDASLVLHAGEKVGVVGANGAGKSSLFGLLLGQLHEDAGQFSLPPSWRLASVAQQAPSGTQGATDFVLQGDPALVAAAAELEAAQPAGGERLAHAQDAWEQAGGWSARARAQALLGGLGFSADELDRPVDAFSGGWRMRLALARALMCPSEVLLLDEPTNHLDLDALVWLEQWLRRYEGLLLVISHDREFLDAVTRVTVLVEGGRLERFSGNYSAFEAKRAEMLAQQQGAYARQQDEIARLTRFIERFRAKATKARQAQSRAKALERLERVAPVWLAAPLRFDFPEPAKVPQQPVTLDGVDCGYVDPRTGSCRRVLTAVRRTVAAGARIGVLGANGQGKSTLVKTIAGVLPALPPPAHVSEIESARMPNLSKALRYGKDTEIGYFAQHELEVLRPDESPLAHLQRLERERAGNAREQDLRNWLGRFQFRDAMVQQPVGSLSGGEKARLVLAMIVWQRPNLLLLDEPTNHLDMSVREALTLALAQYEGAVLLVSHDRALLRAVCDQFWLVHDGQVTDFDGDLDDYQRFVLGTRSQPGGTAAPLAAPAAGTADAPADDAPPGAPASGPRKRDDKRDEKRREAAERQRLAALRKPWQQRIDLAEAGIAKLESELKPLERELADADTYQRLAPDELASKLRRSAELRRQLEAFETQWLEAQEGLQAAVAATALAASP